MAVMQRPLEVNNGCVYLPQQQKCAYKLPNECGLWAGDVRRQTWYTVIIQFNCGSIFFLVRKEICCAEAKDLLFGQLHNVKVLLRGIPIHPQWRSLHFKVSLDFSFVGGSKHQICKKKE